MARSRTARGQRSATCLLLGALVGVVALVGCSAYVARAQAAEHLAVIHDFDQSHVGDPMAKREVSTRAARARVSSHHRGSHRSDGHHRDARDTACPWSSDERRRRARARRHPRRRGFGGSSGFPLRPVAASGSETSSTGATSSRRTTPRVRLPPPRSVAIDARRRAGVTSGCTARSRTPEAKPRGATASVGSSGATIPPNHRPTVAGPRFRGPRGP